MTYNKSRGNREIFGKLIGLRPITTTDNQYTYDNTKIIKVTEPTYERLRDHSSRYYNGESYDTIIRNLLDYYEESHDRIHF